jgi:hypothetical protein
MTKHASRADREHFQRIADANGPLPEDAPPRSLAEVFERLDAILALWRRVRGG